MLLLARTARAFLRPATRLALRRPAPAWATTARAATIPELEQEISAQGSKVKALKTGDGDADTIKAEVAVLLKLKQDITALDPTHASAIVDKKKKKPPAKALEPKPARDPTMDQIVQLCRQRGFVFGSSEIYNGFNGFYDYGPMGCELKRNIKDLWWRDFVHGRDEIHGLDSSIICNPGVWRASGHVEGFSDPMCDDRETKKRYRADQLFWGEVLDADSGAALGAVTVMESEDIERDLAAAAPFKNFKRPIAYKSVAEATDAEMARVPPPGAPDRIGDLTPPRAFNLMFETKVGAAADAAATAYLRPETAQGIFVNFKNVAATARGFSIPGGVAQIGKAFRNEITPRNFVFRSREFEQMEIEYFCSDEGDAWKACHEEWVAACRAWLVERVGLREELLGEEVHDELAHYARACTDLTFRFPFGEQELQGIAARGCYDLTQHQEASGKSLEYVDQASGRKYLPQVIEPSIGVDRLFLAAICSAYCVDEVGGSERTLLKFAPALAPVKCAVLPLSKKDPALLAIARAIHDDLKRRYNVQWDAAGNIGRRYRRQDEIGTPLCVTVDFESIEDGCVTVRDRDSTDQIRVTVEDVAAHVVGVIEGL